MRVVVVGGGLIGTATANTIKSVLPNAVVSLVERHASLRLETSARSTECFRLAFSDATMRNFVGRSVQLLQSAAERCNAHFSTRGYLFVGSQRNAMLQLANSFCDSPTLPRVHENDLMAYDRRAGKASGVDFICGQPLAVQAFDTKLPGEYFVHMRDGGWFDSLALVNGLSAGVDSVLLNTNFSGLVFKDERRKADGISGVKLSKKLPDGKLENFILDCDVVVLSMGPSLPAYLSEIVRTPVVPFFNEIHAHCLFTNKSLPETLPLTFFSDPVPEIPWTNEQKAAIELLVEEESRDVLLEDLPSGLHFRRLPNDTLDCIWTWDRDCDITPHFQPQVPSWYPLACLGGLASYLPEHFGADLQRVSFSDKTQHRPFAAVTGAQLPSPPSLREVIAGYYTKTVENRPLICPVPGIPGVHINGFFSGFGMMSAMAAAELTALRIAGETKLPSYAKAFDIERYNDAAYIAKIPQMSSGQL